MSEIVALLVTPEDAAKALGIGRTRVYDFIKSGELESVLIGRSRRVPTDALTAFVSALRAEPSPSSVDPSEILSRLRCKPDCMLDFAHDAPRECILAWDGLTPDAWDMEWRPTPGQAACKECRRALNYPSRPLDWVPLEDVGHDPVGHKISYVLMRGGLRLADTAHMSDGELLALRNVGISTLSRIRERQARIVGDVGAEECACGTPLMVCDCGEDPCGKCDPGLTCPDEEHVPSELP